MHLTSFCRSIAVLGAAATLAGCETLPANGPMGEAFSRLAVEQVSNEAPVAVPYVLVEMSEHVIRVLDRHRPRLASVFHDARPEPGIRLGIGDIVQVTVFEQAAGGLFIPAEAGVRPGNFVTLPNQAVDATGNIEVPYAGRVQARGRTALELQKVIETKLANKALGPQVIVSLVDQRSSLISVMGDSVLPTRITVNGAGERILDAIARASGPRTLGYETWVMLERNGRRATTPFESLIHEPANNLYVRAQDTIYVFRQPRTFVAVGATGQQGNFPFDSWRFNMAEALAKSSGLNDALAEPSNVFLYRGESREVLAEIGVDTSGFEGPVVPVIYNLNLRDPSGMFLAARFEMHNRDILYASNARSIETTKLLTYIRAFTATVNDPINAGVNAATLSNLIRGTSGSTVAISTASK